MVSSSCKALSPIELVYSVNVKLIKTLSKLAFLLNQSQILYSASLKADDKVTKTEDFLLLSRMLIEQLDENEIGDLFPKLGSEI